MTRLLDSSWTPNGDSGGSSCKSLRNLVGLAGFEPATSCTPSKRATRLRHSPNITQFTRPLFPIFTIAVWHHSYLILTLTMNPAIDRTIAVDRLAFDDRAYILSSNDSAGGRGINASSVIHNFGGKTLAILPAGGEPARPLRKVHGSLRLPSRHRPYPQ